MMAAVILTSSSSNLHKQMHPHVLHAFPIQHQSRMLLQEHTHNHHHKHQQHTHNHHHKHRQHPQQQQAWKWRMWCAGQHKRLLHCNRQRQRMVNARSTCRRTLLQKKQMGVIIIIMMMLGCMRQAVLFLQCMLMDKGMLMMNTHEQHLQQHVLHHLQANKPYQQQHSNKHIRTNTPCRAVPTCSHPPLVGARAHPDSPSCAHQGEHNNVRHMRQT